MGISPPEPGNIRALKSGAYSPALVDLKADEVRRVVTDAAPWTAVPALAGTLELDIRTLATALFGLAYTEQVVAEKGYLWHGAAATCRDGQCHDEHSHARRNAARARPESQGHDHGAIGIDSIASAPRNCGR